jgi:hypothetical protein
MTRSKSGAPFRRKAVTLVAVALLVIGVFRFSNIETRVLYSILVTLGVLQSDFDLRWRSIPRAVTYTMGIAASVVWLAVGVSPARPFTVSLVVLGGFWIVHRWKPSGLGLGDVLLAPVLCMYVCWFDLRLVPLWLMTASLGAAVSAIIRKQRHLAFVPWMVGGAIAIVLVASNANYGS